MKLHWDSDFSLKMYAKPEHGFKPGNGITSWIPDLNYTIMDPNAILFMVMHPKKVEVCTIILHTDSF